MTAIVDLGITLSQPNDEKSLLPAVQYLEMEKAEEIFDGLSSRMSIQKLMICT